MNALTVVRLIMIHAGVNTGFFLLLKKGYYYLKEKALAVYGVLTHVFW